MKVVIATPLYPPDIAAPAPYVKELAKRLSKKHAVTIVAYGSVPEEIPEVSIVSVSKRHPTVIRLFLFGVALFKVFQKADVLLIENGASVELPASVVSLFTGHPFILHMGDTRASAYAQKKTALKFIQSIAKNHAKEVVHDIPLEKPEILPFAPPPQQALDRYEESWTKHLALLQNIFTHGK